MNLTNLIEIRNYARGNIRLPLGVGVDYPVSQSWQLYIEPVFKPKIGFYEDEIGNSHLYLI